MSEKVKPNFGERALYAISPEWGERAYRNRAERRLRKQSEEHTGRTRMSYKNNGASSTKSSVLGWSTPGDAAEDGIDLNASDLRKRARDLFEGGGVARSAPCTLTTNVIGWGITPKPKIDGAFLGLSEEAADEWEKNTLREFHLWAKCSACDHERQGNFYDDQKLAFLSQLLSGDCFVLFGMREDPRTPYQLTIRILEADRVSTPDSSGDSESKALDDGGRIIDGVEIDKEGVTRRYHIANRHPLNGEDSTTLEWEAIDAIGKETGQPNVLHLMTRERPEQRRGIPLVSAQIVQLKQLARYTDSELASAVVSSMLAVFLESDVDDGNPGLEDSVNDDEKVSEDPIALELRPGIVVDLPPGKKVNSINPLRQNNGFKDFVDTLITIIGAGHEIPKEVLIHKYDSNYTAARSALIDFWRVVKSYRRPFNDQFNQPIYEAWLTEAVASGRVEAPGFFDDPAIRAAWCGCQWLGASMGHVDPKKEIEAAAMRIALNISTQEQEAAEYNGGNWDEIISQRLKEIQTTQTDEQATIDNGEEKPDKSGNALGESSVNGGENQRKRRVYGGLRWPGWMPKISEDKDEEEEKSHE